MKSIDVSPYKVTLRGLDENGKVVSREEDYQVKDSLITILFAQTNHLTAKQTLFHNRIAEKIESCNFNLLLLEDAEYEALKKSVESISGFSRNDVELINRVNNAEDYVVK